VKGRNPNVLVNAAAVFAAWRRPWRVLARLDRRALAVLAALGAVLAAMNSLFYLAVDRLPLSTVGAIEFLGTVVLAAAGARTRRNAAALALTVAGVAAMTLRRTGYRLPMIVGFGVLAAGLGMMSLSPVLSPYAWLAIAAGLTGCGMGLSVPAANNASLQLAPDQVAAIAGLRGMFRQSGSIIAVSVTTAIIARSNQPGPVQAHVFVVFIVLLVVTVALVRFVPEHKGNW